MTRASGSSGASITPARPAASPTPTSTRPRRGTSPPGRARSRSVSSTPASTTTTTIAGRGDNGLGVAGVSWNATLVGCRAFDPFGALDDILQCMDYFLELKTRPNNPVDIVATNNSWGGGPFSQALYDAIGAHRQAGMLFVAAAGNNSSDTDAFPHYPSSYALDDGRAARRGRPGSGRRAARGRRARWLRELRLRRRDRVVRVDPDRRRAGDAGRREHRDPELHRAGRLRHADVPARGHRRRGQDGHRSGRRDRQRGAGRRAGR